MEKKEEIKSVLQIRTKFEKDKDFRRYYVNGAMGGFKNKYDLRLSFYSTEINDLLINSNPIKFNPELSEEEKVAKINELALKNNILCEIIMSEQAAKELHTFLGKEIKNFERIKAEGTLGINI